eukprot:gene8648-8829_t
MGAAPDPSWPIPDAPLVLRIIKKSGFELDNEPQWMHLHNDPANPAAQQLTLTIQVLNNRDPWTEGLSAQNIQVRYTVMGIPVSKWLSSSNLDLDLSVNAPALNHVKDGVLDISVEVMGTDRAQYKPWPAFLHLKRGRALTPLVPVMVGDFVTSTPNWIPLVTRMDRTDRLTVVKARNNGIVTTIQPRKRQMALTSGTSDAASGYPANPSLTRWTTPPHETDLYVELLTPGGGGLFREMQMWWEDLPSHPGLFFIRGQPTYHGEDPRGVDQQRFPVQDGPRGLGWVSGYIQGKVDNQGRLVFAELAGRVGWLLPTGEVLTIAGWVTSPGYNPVWVRKDISVVRRNQELRGRGELFERVQGFGRPMDVAFDPEAPNVLFVPDLTLHCIWRVEIVREVAGAAPEVQVSLFAGSDSSESGYEDGQGSAARFNQPYSITWVPAGQEGSEPMLYVSDSANHAVRRITLSGEVSTTWASPDVLTQIDEAGVDRFDRGALRTLLRVQVSLSEAAAGARPDIYWPSVLRSDSEGNIILLEHGFGQIRRLSPKDNTAVVLATVDQKFGEWDHGWAWLDVDTTGAAGPVDGIYWCKAVGSEIEGAEGSHFNEIFAWTAKEGGQSHFIFPGRGGGANPVGFGDRLGHTPAHYPWLVAVDPRGGLIMTGMGAHGVSRLRKFDPTGGDPVSTEDYTYFQGQELAYELANLTFRYGHGAHNMLQMGLDGWLTQGMVNNTDALLDYYGISSSLRNDEDLRNQLVTYLKKQTGPRRDGLPTAAADRQAPTAPNGLTMQVGTYISRSSIMLKWNLAKDNRAVASYQLQLVRGASATFTPANAVAGYFNVDVGNTEVLLMEGLTRGQRYHARLRARDLSGRAGPWSAAKSFTLP